MQIDEGLLLFNNRPLRVPQGPTQVHRQPSGAAAGSRVAGASAAGARAEGGAARIDKKSKLYEQCQAFEAIFVKMMLKEMRNSVDKSNSLISGGWAEDIYSDMLDDEYSKTMAKNAGFGLSDELYKQLAKA